MAGGKSYWLECSEIDKQYNRTFWYRCVALKNLQFLKAKDNRKKQNKINKPFQPSLKL